MKATIPRWRIDGLGLGWMDGGLDVAKDTWQLPEAFHSRGGVDGEEAACQSVIHANHSTVVAIAIGVHAETVDPEIRQTKRHLRSRKHSSRPGLALGCQRMNQDLE